MTEGGAGCGGKDHCRTDAPDDLSGFRGREEEGWAHVSDAVLAAGVFGGVGLPDDGLNDSGDEHPVLADACRDDGLDVEHVLSAVIRPDSEVGVVLDGNADEAGYGVLGGFGEGVGIVCGWRGGRLSFGSRGCGCVLCVEGRGG